MDNALFKTSVENGKRYLYDYYVYSASYTDLAAAASQTGRINIEADADFVVEKMTFFAEIAGAVQTDASRVIPLATMLINDSGSGRNLQNEPVYIPSIFGDGRLPFVLPLPRTFRANSTISVTAANVSAATTYANLQISFIGYKKFFMGNA